jgi:hypothetical protein
MLFKIQTNDSGYLCEWKSNDGKLLLRMSLPECSPIAFEMGFKQILQDPTKHHYLENYAACVDQLSVCEFQGNFARLAFIQSHAGLLKALEGWKANAPWREKLTQDPQQYLKENSTLNFQARLENKLYIFGLRFDEISYEISYDYEPDDSRTCIYPEEWDLWREKRAISPELLASILNNLDTLSEIVDQLSHSLNNSERLLYVHSFGSFCKYLIRYLDETSESQLIALRYRVIPHLCAVVILDEYENPEEQKQYLERIFDSRQLSPDDRLDLLVDISEGLLDDANHRLSLLPRLTSVLSTITEYYLSQFDFDHAKWFWHEFILRKDLLLHGLLSLYSSPALYAGGALVLTLFTILPGLYSSPPGWWITTAAWISAIFLCLILVFTTGFIVWVIYRFSRGLGFEYISLFFPRLIGAAAVGLSLLAFQNTAWDIGEHLPFIDWLLIFISTLVASFLYFFYDVHKNTRLLPLPALTGVAKKTVSSISTPATPNLILRSIKTSRTVFFIGTFEAFVLTLVASTLLASAADPTLHEATAILLWKLGNPLSLSLLYDKANVFLGFRWELLISGGTAAMVTFMPRLVLLWTGLILLIGAFGQLIWQDI